VEPHPGADLGDSDRVGDELVAGVAALVGVAVAGELEGLLDPLAVDRRHRDRGAGAAGQRPVAVAVFARGGVELLDHRNEIGQELLVLYRGLGLARNRWASESRSPYAR